MKEEKELKRRKNWRRKSRRRKGNGEIRRRGGKSKGCRVGKGSAKEVSVGKKRRKRRSEG